MTRKNFNILCVVMFLITTMLLTVPATALEVTQWDSNENLKTVYITWQYPIPSSEKGDKLNMSVGVLINGVMYASHDVFNLLGIPKCPVCEGTVITVDGETAVYYPLRKSAEQFGYSVLWAQKNEWDGNTTDYWVYIAKKQPDSQWVQVVSTEVPEDNYKSYDYHYAYSDDTTYRWFVTEDEVHFVLKEDAIVVE